MTLDLANLVIASALAGLIWTIQLVGYPLFAFVGPEEWPLYGAEHRQRITWIAAPLMLANIACAATLVGAPLGWINAALAGGNFALTGLLFAPMHGRLEERAGAAAVRRLVRANWVRTAAWTAQVVVAVALAS